MDISKHVSHCVAWEVMECLQDSQVAVIIAALKASPCPSFGLPANSRCLIFSHPSGPTRQALGAIDQSMGERVSRPNEAP